MKLNVIDILSMTFYWTLRSLICICRSKNVLTKVVATIAWTPQIWRKNRPQKLPREEAPRDALLAEFLNLKKADAPPSLQPVDPDWILGQDDLSVNNAEYSFIKYSALYHSIEKVVDAEDNILIQTGNDVVSPK